MESMTEVEPMTLTDYESFSLGRLFLPEIPASIAVFCAG